MSDLQEICQQINQISEASANIALNLNNVANNLQQSIAYTDSLIQGTSQGSYTVVVNQLNEAQKRLRSAAVCLRESSSIGQAWLSQHTGVAATGSFSSGNSSVDIGEPQNGSIPDPKVLSPDLDAVIAEGMNAIDAQEELVREDCKDKGITDAEEIESVVKNKREESEIELYNDIYGNVEDRSVEVLGNHASQFSLENWRKMDETQKETALNSLALDVGKALRTDIKGIKTFDGPVEERGYYCNDGYLYLNSDVLSDESQRLDAVDTIFHEGRHAYQHEAISNPHRYGVTKKQAKLWEMNFNHYVRPEVSRKLYFKQPVEQDAYGFADRIMTAGGVL